MKDSQEILNQLEQKIAPSPSNSTTAAGPHSSLTPEKKAALVDAINESFELLRINYQHLYFSAYKEIDALNAAKRLWLENLSTVMPETITQATHEVIKESDYLPTISRLVKKCLQLQTQNQLPDSYSAYIEACQATTPRQNYHWRHPAVYYAGKKTGWLFLRANDEAIAFPAFENHYTVLCEKVARGEKLPAIEPLALPSETSTPLSKEENAERMEALQKLFV